MGLYIEFNENEFTASRITPKEIAELRAELDKLEKDYSSDDNSVAKVSIDPLKPFTFHICIRRHEKNSSKRLVGSLGKHPSAKWVVKAMRDLLGKPAEG